MLIYEASPTVRFCRIENNQGGGIECWSGSPTIESCLIRNNTAGYGAGVYSVDSAAIIRSNVLAENHASEEGAAIYSGFSQDWIINNTIVANTADGDGLGGAAILCILDGDAGIFNNIFHQNTDYDIVAFDAFPAVACNLFDDVPSEYDSCGNIAGDPQLVDWPGGDYHIPYSSPCLNAGSPAYGPMEGVIDLDGQVRVMGARVDMGADEVYVIPGDLDADGDVDLDDYSAFVAAMNGPNQASGNAVADFDGDNDCDLADFAMFGANFTGPL